MNSKIEKAVQWAISIANDNSHGYSQVVRYGPSYDCSSLIITAFSQAGFNLPNATYTGNMYPAFIAAGFSDITKDVNLKTGYGLIRGDILLNYANHTAIYIGNGQLVHARSAEGTNDTRDNSGNEIRTQNYFNYPWEAVLRMKDSAEATVAETDPEIVIVPSPQINSTSAGKTMLIKYGMQGPNVKALQNLLIYHGYDIKDDSEFGILTRNAVVDFQKKHGLEADGIAGKDTFTELIKEKQ